MKLKILSVVLIVMAVFWSIEVKADPWNGYVYEGEVIPGIYYYKHREDTETEKYTYHNFHSEARVNRLSDSNDLVYCIESWQPLTGANRGDYSITSNGALSKLTSEQLERIKKIIYFGFAYQDKTHDHTDLKWYAITQLMIWQIESPNIEHYFVDSITSKTPLHTYDNEIAEINTLVDSITNQKINYNESIMLGATKTIKINNLDQFTITNSSNLVIETNYDDNTIKIIPTSSGTGQLTLRRLFTNKGTNFRYYLSDNYQNAMSVGDLEDEVIKYNILVNTGTLKLKPFESDEANNTRIPLEEYTYGIYAQEDIIINGVKVYSSGDLVKESSSINGVVTFDNLPIGKYYYKEISDMSDYYDDKKVGTVTIKDTKIITKELDYHRQKLKINLKKYLSSPIIKDKNIFYSLITAEGIKFGLYNEDDELITSATTTKTGDVLFDVTIPYGNYYVKEISTLNNYYLSDFILPIKFIRNGKTEYQTIGDGYEIINYYKKCDLTIIKVDEDTLKPLSGVKFYIYNELGEIVKEVTTDEFGLITVSLPYGNYYIQEIKTLANYELNNQKIPISINSDIITLKITNKIQEQIIEDNTEEDILKPNLNYEPIEVKLAKTDDYNKFNYIFYISIVSLIITYYVKKINS